MGYEIPVFLELEEVPGWLVDPRKFWGQTECVDDKEERARQLDGGVVIERRLTDCGGSGG